MPKQSRRQALLKDLESAKQDLQVARYVDLLAACIHLLRAGADSDSDMELSGSSTSDTSTSDSELLDESDTDLLSLLASSDVLPPLLTFSPAVQQYEYQITALEDEVKQARYLANRRLRKAARAPQLQLLEQWALDGDIDKFRRKLRVDPDVFKCIVDHIQADPGFSNNSNNPQFPVSIQLAIFLNRAGHYGWAKL
ncbi:hypothetical protein EV363DRAFT_1454614 [Boletus edulis]|nr:hypothetical protein EV363DRAFT_1454614 [Boletus edulis]